MDLDDPSDRLDNATKRISGMLAENGFDRAFLVGYGTDAEVTPLILPVARRLTDMGVEVGEILRVYENRWWSYRCEEPGCCPAGSCPPEGTPFDISTSVIAAQATVAGQVALASRAELARTVAPLDGPARAAMRVATHRAERRLTAAYVAASRAPIGSVPPGGPRVAEGVPLVKQIVERLPELPTDEEIAWLGVLLTHVRVRDEAWVRIDPDRASDHIVLWREVLRRVERSYTPAPASLLAYAAFIAGDGGLANVALDRAFDVDPGYTMAELLRDVIQAGVPPSAARLRMNADDLAEAWNDLHNPDDPDDEPPIPAPPEPYPPEPDLDPWPPDPEPQEPDLDSSPHAPEPQEPDLDSSPPGPDPRFLDHDSSAVAEAAAEADAGP
jgi:hypothetical protein